MDVNNLPPWATDDDNLWVDQDSGANLLATLLANDGDIDLSAMERPLDTEEAQSHEQSMLAEFAREHEKLQAAKASSAA